MRQLVPEAADSWPALVRAEREAAAWGHPEVDVEHVFLALTDVPSPARGILLANGLSYVIVGLALERLLGQGRGGLRARMEQATGGASAPSLGPRLSWSPRALGAVGSVATGRDIELLGALLDERSGAVAEVVAAAGASAELLTRTIAARQPQVARHEGVDDPRAKSLSIAHAVRVAVPAAEVWSLVEDPLRWPAARSELSVCPLQSGTWEFTIARGKKARRGTITLLARDAPWGATFEVAWHGGPHPQRHSFVVVDEGDGTTLELYVQSDFRSRAPRWTRRYLAGLVARVSRRRAHDELERVARHLEGRPGPDG